MRRPGLTGGRQQRGAVAVMAGVLIVALLASVMLGIELGRLYKVKRALQGAASLAALDAARVVGGCSAINPDPTQLSDEVRNSLTRNGFDGDALLQGDSEILFGQERVIDGLRTLDTNVPIDEATSVGIRLSQPFPDPLFPLLAGGDTPVLRSTAFATQSVIGQISVGTSLLSLDAGDPGVVNGLLSGLLGSSVNLSVLAYQGLANATVDLLQMARLELGVIRPDDLLALSLDLPDALRLVEDTVAAVGNVDPVVQSALAAIANAAGGTAREVRLGDVIALEPGLESAADELPINLFDLLMALAQGAAQGEVLTLPLSVNLPGLLGLNVRLAITEPPQIAVGRPGYYSDGTPRTQARSAQLRLLLDLQLLNVFGGGGVVSLPLIVEGASATATLDEVRCASRGIAVHEATVLADTAVARLAIGQVSDLGNPAAPVTRPPPLVNLLGLLTVEIDQPIVVELADTGALPIDFTGPFVPAIETPDPSHQTHIGASTRTLLSGAVQDLGDGLSQHLTFGGLLGFALNLLGLGQLLGLVLDLLSPVLALVDGILASLLDLLGVSLGTANVQMQALDVGAPYIFAKND